jgi:hypothetical protein
VAKSHQRAQTQAKVLTDQRTGKRMEGCLADFTVKPEPSKRWCYQVKIFDTIAHADKYFKSYPGRARLSRNGVAICSNWTVLRNGRTRPECGEIVFVKDWLSPNIVAHECTHAVLSWSERMKIDLNKPGTFRKGNLWASADEERFCDALGEMTCAILVKLTKLGFYD